MPSQRALGIAVVGTGKMGADHVRRLQHVISGARVTAVVDIDANRAKTLADETEGCTAYTEAAVAMAAQDVDAVLIASPGPAHEAALLDALGRDLPVLCEKPLTPDAASALRVLEAEQRLGHRRIQVGFMRRYDTEYIKLKRLLDGGELGRALMLHHRHRNLSMPPWFTNEMLINSSVVHEMDVTRWLLDQEITAVTVHKQAPRRMLRLVWTTLNSFCSKPSSTFLPTSRSSVIAGTATKCMPKRSANAAPCVSATSRDRG